MSKRKTILGAVGAIGLCALLGGCQSMAVMAIKTFDQKPYSLPVEARELAPPAALEASVDARPAEVAAAPAPAPARIDVAGQGDGAMTDTRIVVTARAKDIPHTSPDFSREQVAAMVCSVRVRGGNDGKVKAALRAYDATLAAWDTRLAYDAGQRTLKQADDVEKKRQDAVKGMLGGGLLFDMTGGMSKKGDLPKPEQDGVFLEAVDLFTFTENGQAVMAVSGIVRNSKTERVELSPITLQALDRWQFILAGQTSLLPFEALGPGESKPFEVRFHNPPDTTYEVAVHFAPPFEYRARRECNPADPNSVPVAPHTAKAAAAITAPMHTAGELNQLMRAYRGEAQSAWGQSVCSDPEKIAKAKTKQEEQTKPKSDMKVKAEGSGERRGGTTLSIGMKVQVNFDTLCAAWARRAPWRDMFVLAETTDDAWGAMLAVAELRGQNAPQAEIEAAERAQRASYGAFRAMGARMLARGGARVAGVDVQVASSTFGYEQMSKVFSGGDLSAVGHYVDVSGTLRNTGAAPATVGALMLALVDRLEQPLLTYRIESPMTLAPGELRPFNARVFFNEPVERKSEKDTPPWQVRIGAFGG